MEPISDALAGRLLSAVPGLVFVFDARTHEIVHVNAAVERATGFAMWELAGMPIQQLAPQASPHEIGAALDLLATGRRDELVVESTLRARDGSECPVEIRLAYVAGDPPVFVALVVDLRERVDAARRLAESENRCRTLFASSPTPGLLVDPSTATIVDANAATVEFFRRPLGELRGMRLDRLSPLPPEEIERNIRAAARGRTRRIGRGRIADGEERTVEVFLAPIDIDDRPLVYAVIHDMTEHAALARQQARLQALTELVAETGRAIRDLDDEQAVFDATCSVAVQSGPLCVVWIALAEPSGELRRYASAADPRYPLEWPSTAPAQSIASIVLREGAASAVPLTRANLTTPLRRQAHGLGLRSMAGAPLRSGEFIVGALCAYADEEDFFGEHEMRLLEQLAGDVGARLAVLQRERARRERDDELVRAGTQLQALFDWAPVGIAVTVPGAGGHVRRNPALVEMFGYRSPEDMPESPFDLLAPASARAIQDAIGNGRQQPDLVEFDAVGRRRDGTHFPVHVVLLRVDAPGGNFYVTFASEQVESEHGVPHRRSGRAPSR